MATGPGGESSPGSTPPPETMDDMLQRHRKEAKDLQGKELEMKKGAAKGSKAEQKAKKKQVEEAIAKLGAEMKARHAQEVSSFKAPSGEASSSDTSSLNQGTPAAAGVVAGLEALVLKGEGEVVQGRMSKAQKRRDKKAQEDLERQRRIAEEQSSVVSDRTIEDQQLSEQLRPLGLGVKEVKPDGHCLFRAIEDQLKSQDTVASSDYYLELRRLAADYMRAHADDFIPFLDVESNADLDGAARLQQYCETLVTTAAWGGQLELQALAKKLNRSITVYCAGKPNIEISPGEVSAAAKDSTPLRLSYHQHAFGLGEHYNSVVQVAVESDTDPPEPQDEL